MMEKAVIGFNAGRVWRYLKDRGEADINKMCLDLGQSFDNISLAVGWLARENKVIIRRKDGALLISINNVEFAFG
ncbi:MAG: winged helix-turn-helix domain-containing protein [Prevotella pleuritidis]|nr:winged helix-turn-helix domain-containing protein [Hoylesella pleuritidis]